VTLKSSTFFGVLRKRQNFELIYYNNFLKKQSGKGKYRALISMKEMLFSILIVTDF